MKKLFLSFAILFSLCVLCGCESKVYFYNYPGDDGATYVLDFFMSNDEMNVLDNSAKTDAATKHNGYLKKSGYLAGINAKNGDPWTVEQYIRAAMEIGCPEFTFYDKRSGNKETSISFMCQVLYGNDSETDDGEEDSGSGMEITRGFFFYTIHVEQDSIFNVYKNIYYNDSGDNAIGSTAISIVKNGLKESRPISVGSENYEQQRDELLADGFVEAEKTNDRVTFEIEVIPPFAKAFPIVEQIPATYSPDKLTVNYVLQSDNKMITSGSPVQYDEYGNKYYFFSTTFNEKSDKIEFNYIRANSIGWNILAILIGLATVGGLMLYCKFHKPKEPKKSAYAAAKERFPYDPYEKIDPFEEYNVKKKDDNNPFEGY